MLAALIASPAVDLVDLGIVADGVAGLSNSLLDASDNLDLLITSGGVAGSEADPVAGAMSRLDAPFHPLKLALRPGKPIGHGCVGVMRVLALPGNPVAAMANLLLFGRPLMAALTGAAGQLPRGEAAVAAALFGHRPGRTELVPARITGTAADGRPLVGKLGRGGSARLLPLVAADGFACVPASVGDLPAGAPLLFYSFRNGFSL
jgi:molybdopterin molybdotransferase